MSNKCRAYSASKIGLEKPDNRKAFYAGWDAAIKQVENQKPVGWWNGKEMAWFEHETDRPIDDCTIPLYTAPPKREWQGLTDEEIFDVIRSLCADNETAEMLIHVSMDEYRAIEAKIKEKNK